jgi:nicotinamide-nucleotide amidase
MNTKSAISDAALRRLSARVARKFRKAGETLVTAESCSGGLLAKCLTDLPGSSDYFDRGWVTYSNAAKQAELGIEASTLAQFGAVSETVAVAMARGALKHSRAEHAVAITGIAGPAGGTRDKPVGLVWVAWGRRRAGRIRVYATGYRFSGSRDTVRRWTVVAALVGLLER